MSTLTRRLRAVAPLLVCLVVVAALVAAVPAEDGESRYRYRDVAVGQRGELREYDATVTAVRTAGAVQGSPDVVTTEHAFVLVTIEVAVRLDGQSFSAIALLTRDGRRYLPRPGWIGSGPDPGTQPGFSSRGTLVFEVPRARLPGAVLVIGPDNGEVTTYDTAVRVDLALTDDPPPTAPVTVPAREQWVTR